MGQERALRAVDEANLVLDHPGQVNVFLVAGLLAPGGFVCEDGRLNLDAVRVAVAHRVAELPALRQIPVRAARHRHEWAEREPDLDYHVRLLPAVDDVGDLERLCGHLMAQPLPRTRPLWELLVAPAPAGAAMVLRIHHAVADGMAAAELIRRLFDTDIRSMDAASPASVPPRASTAPTPSGPGHRLLFGARRIAMTLVGQGLAETLLLGERSARHGVVFADADLDAVAARAHRVGATVNDAVLAAAAAGYRAAVAGSGEPMPPALPVSVPVALSRTGDSRNQVGVMLVRLPLDAASPDEVLSRIAAQTRIEKVEARRQGTLELMRGPVGARIMDRIAHRQHLVGGFVTNVPGPQRRLELAGAPVTQLWPVAVLAANVRLGVAAVSYAGRLCLGIHFDAAYIDGAAVGAAVRRELKALTA